MKKLIVLAGFAAFTFTLTARDLPKEIVCEGRYPWHLQGAATDGTNVYWTFTTVLAKTDLSGKLLGTYGDPASHAHMGDLTVVNGKVYIGMNMSHIRGRKGDEVWQIDAATMKLDRVIPTPQTIFCNNGVEWCDGFFYAVANIPHYCPYNVVFVYDRDWNFFGARLIESGWTFLGVQTIARIGDKLAFGCYGAGEKWKQPHKGCTFYVDPKDLQKNWENRESSRIVPCLERRETVSCSEGMFELDGKPWGVGSRRLKAPADWKFPQCWTAVAHPTPALAFERKPQASR